MSDDKSKEVHKIPQTTPRYSATFDEYTNSEIRRAAATGIHQKATAKNAVQTQFWVHAMLKNQFI